MEVSRSLEVIKSDARAGSVTWVFPLRLSARKQKLCPSSDCLLRFKAISYEQLNDKINKVCGQLQQWFSANGLIMILTKSNIMLFSGASLHRVEIAQKIRELKARRTREPEAENSSPPDQQPASGLPWPPAQPALQLYELRTILVLLRVARMLKCSEHTTATSAPRFGTRNCTIASSTGKVLKLDFVKLTKYTLKD
ncbi:uncharacterized protein [Choristoneura fumiferana]|uniref:uncharacterized protein n=1 Tax=Choristoneura fumiferana TaxID=7141 RepID=UPI003D157CB7